MVNIKKWYAIYTKPRWEKKVDSKLILKGIESWCPLQKKESQWSDRKKIIDDPLFKSYVFVKIDETERVKTLQTEGVLNFVHHIGKPAIIRDEEIAMIKSYLFEKHTRLSVESSSDFKTDDKVKIRHGIFMDNTGIVLKTGNKKIYVKLESLGQIMIVEFPANYASKILND